MKTLAKYLTVIFATLLVGGCSPGNFIKKTVRPREDIRTVSFSVPAIESQECRTALLKILDPFSVAGTVTETHLDTEQQLLEIKYNSRELNVKNLEYAIARAGFDVEDTPGNAAAKENLPEACR